MLKKRILTICMAVGLSITMFFSCGNKNDLADMANKLNKDSKVADRIRNDNINTDDINDKDKLTDKEAISLIQSMLGQVYNSDMLYVTILDDNNIGIIINMGNGLSADEFKAKLKENEVAALKYADLVISFTKLYEDINNDIISKVKNKRGLELMVCTDLSIDDSYIYYMNNGKLKTLVN